MPQVPPIFYMEILYTSVILFSCFLIYAKTRELYDLTNHPGIKFFRYTFIFFGLAYLFRLALLFFRVVDIDRSFVHAIAPYMFFFISYAGTMAILALFYSVAWKKIGSKHLNSMLTLHIIAIVTSAIAFVLQAFLLVLALQTGLFASAVIASYISYRRAKRKGFSQIYAMYMLLFLFWILNILAIFLPRFFIFGDVIIYAVSIGLFLLILSEVSSRVGRHG